MNDGAIQLESGDDSGEEITNLDGSTIMSLSLQQFSAGPREKNDSAPMNESDWTFSKSFLY